jgi:hypothetical protein
MGDLCRLFSRNTWLNISIYVIVVLFVCLFGSLWIFGKKQTNPKDEKYWTDCAYISAIIGLIIVSILMSINCVLFEIEFKQKCEYLERFIKQQVSELSERLDPKNLAGNASRAVAETFTTSFKSQLKQAIVDQIKKEFPDIESVTKLLSMMSGKSKK